MGQTFTIRFDIEGKEFEGDFETISNEEETFYELQAVHPELSSLKLPMAFHLKDGYVVPPSSNSIVSTIAQNLEQYIMAHSG